MNLFCIFISSCWAYIYILYDYMCTYLWLPILYTYLIMVTYFVHRELLECLACTHMYFPMFDLFFKNTTSSWHSLYTSEIVGVFCIFTSLWWDYLYMGDFFMHVSLVTYSVHMEHLTASSVHTTPNVDLNLMFHRFMP